MYCIVEIQGHQYKVTPGDQIDVEKIARGTAANPGEANELELEFDKVLFIQTGSEVEGIAKIGLPYVDGAKVRAKIVREAKDRKQIVFKRKPGRYQKKRGHRQEYTSLLITEIEGGSTGGYAKIDSTSLRAKKYLTQ